MRIGLLSTSYPTREDDAAGRFVEAMAHALVARGHAVDALFPEHPTRDHPRGSNPSLAPLAYARPRHLERTFYGAGVPDNVRANPAIALLGGAFSLRLLAEAQSRARRWDAVVAHFLLPTGLVAATLGLPAVVIAHSADLHLLERLPGRRALARFLDARATLWFVSDDARRRFERVLGRHLRRAPLVSPMGIAPILPYPRGEARASLGLSEAAFVVAALARLVPIKGLDVAIDALAGRRDAVLVVGGEGPEADALARRAARLGVDLRLLGPLGPEGKRTLFGAADAFVVPSRTLPSGRSEGVPVAMLEALSAGLPVVASRVGGIPSAALPGVVLVPEGDPAALAAALRGPLEPPRDLTRLPTWDALASRLEAALDQGRTTSVFRGGV